MSDASASLDLLFKALADPTRRQVIASLCRGPAAVSDLAAPYEMAMPSFLQHLRVLEKSGLVRSRKDGRVRTCALVPARFQRVEGWLSSQRQLWTQRLDQLDGFVLELKEAKK